MEVKLPRLGGIDAARQIARWFPLERIVMLTYYADDAYIRQAFLAELWGTC